MTTKHHVLVVDDDLLCLTAMRAHLADTAYEVHIAKSGQEAWETLRTSGCNFSAILLDRKMPNGNGMSLLSRVKKSAAYAHIPIIMITSDADTQEAIAAFKQGVFDFLRKPVDASILHPLLERAINHLPL